MVTAVVNVASAAANGATGTTSAGNGAGNGRDESEFAQLLDGMDAEVAKSASPPEVVAGKAAAFDGEADAASNTLSAEMLAMCAIPVTPVATTVAPAPVAPTGQQPTTVATTTDSNTSAANQVATATSNTQGNANNADGANASDAFAGKQTKGEIAKTPSNTGAGAQPGTQSNTAANGQAAIQINGQVEVGDARASKQSATKNTAAANAAATAAASASQAASHQDAYQKLAAQVAPMLALANARYESQDSDAKVDAASVDTTTLNNLPAQGANAQSVSDAQALDVTTRHHLRSPVGSHPWAAELGDKLTMMTSKGTQSATLHMTPADLGPVQVRIETNQNQASVWFTAEHAETRSALEQSLPRLREMFNAQGMALTDAGVFGDRSRQQPGYNPPEQGNAAALRFADEEVAARRSSVGGISLSLLDAYA